MDAKLGILSGARAGETLSFSQRTISVGRHPECDLRFDPASDRAVSARHALLFFDDVNWFVRDLGSRNGTLVNDRLITQDHKLRNGDRIAFGAKGPVIQIATGGAPLEGITAARAAIGIARGPSTLERVRIELRRRTRHYQAIGITLLVISVVVIGTAFFLGGRQRAAWDRERVAMRLQIDSLQWAGSVALEALQVQLADLTSALQHSETQVGELRRAIVAAERAGDRGRVVGLQRELQAASDGLRERKTAASLDFRAIQERNRHAVARIFVEFANGEVATATAFAVRDDGTLMTSRHVLMDTDGEVRPRRIAIQFSDSEQVWPARLVTWGRADLAIVKVDNILGPVPTVHALNARPDTLAAGAPVAMLGFPHGGDPGTPDETVGFARPLLSAGIVQEVGGDQVKVQGYGAVGASGSPVLDANGEVVAIVFGGAAEAEGHTVYAVPAPAAAELIATMP